MPYIKLKKKVVIVWKQINKERNKRKELLMITEKDLEGNLLKVESLRYKDNSLGLLRVRNLPGIKQKTIILLFPML